MEGIVFDRETGRIGNRRLLRNSKKEREWGSNYEVAILDPITLDETGEKVHTTDGKWKRLPDDDLRVIFIKLFQAIYDADWNIGASCMNSRCDGHETAVDEHDITNQHKVFSIIRKLFGR